MNADERTVDQLLAEDDHHDPVSARLDAIRHTVDEGGVSATVDLHGRLLDLTIDHTAIRLSPYELATKIQAVSDRAAAGALDDGLAVLGGYEALLRPHLP